MTPHEWVALFMEATSEVKDLVDKVAASGGRRETTGVGAGGDLTIRADSEAEAVIIRVIPKEEVRIVSEEAGTVGDPVGKTVVLVDPVDGSSNYERGIPFYCSSVAVAEGGTLEHVVAGVVRDLVTGDVYTAVKGEGAKKNGNPIHGSSAADPKESVVGVDMSRAPPEVVSSLAPLVAGVKRQVHLGANALEMCLVADGTIDAFVDVRGKLRVTDVAAAYLIVKEAGGVATDEKGAPLTSQLSLESRVSVLASGSQGLHAKISGLL